MFIGNGGVHGKISNACQARYLRTPLTSLSNLGYTDYSSISTTVGKYKFAVAATVRISIF